MAEGCRKEKDDEGVCIVELVRIVYTRETSGFMLDLCYHGGHFLNRPCTGLGRVFRWFMSYARSTHNIV